MRPGWRVVGIACLLASLAFRVEAAPAPLPTPLGLVSDFAGVIDDATEARLTRRIQELKQKTGAEIAVLTVETTAPLDDFSYALRVAEAWKPGHRKEDTGLLVLVAVRDRKLRVMTGYGLEGILPDGLVGQIQDETMVPAFRAGRMEDGILAGVRTFAAHIAASKGVELTGVPPPRARSLTPPMPNWVALLALLVVVLLVMYLASHAPASRVRGRRGVFLPGGGWDGGFGGGFGTGGGGGGGGFGGFGGGSFGGGGAGRSW